MIVSCECGNCLLKDLCINRNMRAGDFESNWANNFMFVTLKCKHLHPKALPEFNFNCDACKNKPICRVFNCSTVSPEDYIDNVKTEINTKCISKLPGDAFSATICCKGYIAQ